MLHYKNREFEGHRSAQDHYLFIAIPRNKYVNKWVFTNTLDVDSKQHGHEKKMCYVYLRRQVTKLLSISHRVTGSMLWTRHRHLLRLGFHFGVTVRQISWFDWHRVMCTDNVTQNRRVNFTEAGEDLTKLWRCTRSSSS